MTAFKKAGLAFFAGLLFLVAPALAAPQFPKLTGRVVDDAQLLSPAAEISLTQKLEGLESRTGRQLVVVTLPSLGGYEIADYGYQLGRHWGIGQKGKNDGVLFIVAPNERSVRIEVGYGLEGVLTDALSSVIISSRVIPRFRQGEYEAGIVSGADALVEQLTLDAPAAKERVAAAERQQREADEDGFSPFILIVAAFFLLSIFGRLFGGRRGRRGALAALPFILMGGGRGGWGGGGFGGGGFGGGGGSFGGGGASGRW